MRNPFVFASVVCVVCSVLLAIAASSLKPLQEYNVEIDRKKNVLKALALYQEGTSMSSKEIEEVYANKVAEKVLDAKGNYMADKTMADVAADKSLLPVYQRIDNSSIALPVEGMGLWSLLQGYFALEKDGKTVAGLTFYEQKETPGLGAEISKSWFTDGFIGKSILNSKGELASVTVAKGKAADYSGGELQNVVDGISGSTITCRGVTDLLKVGLNKYEPYLAQLWAGGSQ